MSTKQNAVKSLYAYTNVVASDDTVQLPKLPSPVSAEMVNQEGVGHHHLPGPEVNRINYLLKSLKKVTRD